MAVTDADLRVRLPRVRQGVRAVRRQFVDGRGVPVLREREGAAEALRGRRQDDQRALILRGLGGRLLRRRVRVSLAGATREPELDEGPSGALRVSSAAHRSGLPVYPKDR